MKKIDIHSTAFQEELSKTWEFVEKVNKNFSWVQNPNHEINENIALGLTRQKMLYGKRYCPCFMVEGETKEEQKAANNRICPCKPAIETEIPEDGKCFCGIFCTKEYHEKTQKNQAFEALLGQKNISGEALKELLEQRKAKTVTFRLIDVREEMEHELSSIEGTDILMPTSTINEEIKRLNGEKEEHYVLYCHAGSRSTQVQALLYDLGYHNITNVEGGIMNYNGAKVNSKPESKETDELKIERELGILYAERDTLLRRLRVISSVVSSLQKSDQDSERCLESIYCVVDALGYKESLLTQIG